MSNVTETERATPRSDEDPNDDERITAETVVADGPEGIEKAKALMGRIFKSPHASDNSQDKHDTI